MFLYVYSFTNTHPTQYDSQNGLKGTLRLPTPMQLKEKILVLCSGADRQSAMREAGADIVGSEDVVSDIQEGLLTDFDRVIATVDMAGVVTSKLARILGPRGLMPSVKSGTLTDDPLTALRMLRSTVPFRIEKQTGIFNIPVARLSMDAAQWETNIRAAIAHIIMLGTGQATATGDQPVSPALTTPQTQTSRKRQKGFIERVSVVSHGGFSMLLNRSEYADSVCIQPSTAAHPVRP